MSNNFGLPERTINELLEFFKMKHEIQRVVIYGSRAKGTYKNGSDIDFAIWSDKENALEIATELDELPTPYMFDVTDYKTLSQENLRKSIDKDGIVFYKRD